MHDTPWYINDYRAWLEEEAEQGQLDPEERFRRRWAELERKRRIRFRTPSIIAPRGNPELPRDILQSPVFSVEKAFGHSLTGDKPLRREHVHARFVAGFNQHNPQTILYIGPRLTQDHKAVLLGLFDVAAGRSPEDEIAIRPREFGVKVCGWSRSIYTREKVKHAIEDLRSAQIYRIWGDDAREQPRRIVDHWRHEKRLGVMYVKLHEDILHFFRGYNTYLPRRERIRFQSGIPSFMYSFVKSNDCEPDAPFTVELFYKMSGADTCMSMSEFAKKLRRSLEQLQEAGVIQRFRRSKGEVHIFKRKKRKSAKR